MTRLDKLLNEDLQAMVTIRANELANELAEKQVAEQVEQLKEQVLKEHLRAIKQLISLDISEEQILNLDYTEQELETAKAELLAVE